MNNMKKPLKISNHEDNYTSENNTPVLFQKKSKIDIVKPLIYIKSDTGKTKHFTPAAQEWFNSIYSYNPHYIKSLSVADTNLMKILKAYFNSEISNNVMNTKRLPTRYKRLSTKKVFVGKGELKHTSNKVIITFYVYNTEKLFLNRAIHLLSKTLYNPARPLVKYTVTDIHNKEIVNYNRPFSLNEFLALPEHYNKWYANFVLRYVVVKNLYLSNLNLQYNILTKMVNLKLITQKDKNEILSNLYRNIDSFNYPNFEMYMLTAKDKYTSHLSNLERLLEYNMLKFRSNFNFLPKLTELVKNIYDKEVEFNIVNLKKMHLNSDIFAQAVALKLRNRNNSLYRVLKSSLRKVKLPKISRVTELFNKVNKDELIINNIRNNNISSMFKDGNDSLNNLLLDFFPDANNLKINKIKRMSNKEFDISLQDYIFKNLKHLSVRGIRIEAKGRITRRLTASRSIFKMKWKGGLKNIDSSFKGLSTIMLRGHVKSNVQHSFVSSKNRNGAFGVKGWVSSK